MENIVLPKVNILSEINDSTNLMIEHNGEINRYPISDLNIGGGDVTIDLDGETVEGAIENINATTLNGFSDNDFVKHGDYVFADKLPKAGFIYPLASATVPEGFLLCDGKEYLINEYPELFAAIGTMYGEGDGSTTFNVPDLQTRVPIGSGEGYELGSTGGEEAHTLTIDEMPSHDHYEKISIAGTGSDLYITGAGNLTNVENSYVLTGESRTGREYQATDSTGGDQPHNNMQPYTVVNYIIATGKNTGVSVQDIITGVQALPLSVEYGGTSATNAEDARKNLGLNDTYNYLDNSDFTQFIAQANIGGNHGTKAYAGDRWILDSGSVTGEANTNGNGYFNITLNGTIRQIIANPPAVGSVFVEMVSGTAEAVYENGEVVITSNGGVIRNVALYDGVYTEANKPKYQPKGYGAELAECLRYFERIGRKTSAILGTAGYNTSSSSCFVTSLPYYKKRIYPTVLLNSPNQYRVLFMDTAGNTFGAATTTNIILSAFDKEMCLLTCKFSGTVGYSAFCCLQRTDDATSAWIDVSADL